MSSAWIYQDDKQVKKHGADKTSWSVGWIDPEGHRRSKSAGLAPKDFATRRSCGKSVRPS